MNELENLRPEVREAVRELDGKAYPGSRTSEHWQTIRAELLRLAKENADLLSTIDLDEQVWVQRDETMHRWIERARNAEAELAALKARIAGSHLVLADGHGGVMWPVGQAVFDRPKGKRVRLLVED